MSLKREKDQDYVVTCESVCLFHGAECLTLFGPTDRAGKEVEREINDE